MPEPVDGERQMLRAVGSDDGISRSKAGNAQDLLAGALGLALALAMWWLSGDLALTIGTRIGPGVAPRVLAGLLAAISVLVFLNGLTARRAGLGQLKLRPILAICGAMLIFALLVETAGLAVASVLTVLCVSLAVPGVRWKQTILVALCSGAFSIIAFVWLLQLNMRAWPW